MRNAKEVFALKKYIAECFGTMILVVLGCGTAMLVGCDPAHGSGYILTAFAFGLAIIAMAYSFGNISGGHVNPAVSLGVLLSGKMSGKDFCAYVVAQCIGALIGSALLAYIFSAGGVTDMTGGFGTNGLAGVNGSAGAGLIIGLTLVGVHILGIGLTGTSVNPARSFGPAVIAMFAGNGAPIAALWVFIAGPLIGAALAAGVYKYLEN